MSERCKHIEKSGFNCGSYAFNLYKDGIDQGNLCDVHYWQAKAQRTWVGLTDEEAQWIYDNGRTPSGMMEMVEAKLKEKNT
jgi:hypothetical protein